MCTRNVTHGSRHCCLWRRHWKSQIVRVGNEKGTTPPSGQAFHWKFKGKRHLHRKGKLAAADLVEQSVPKCSKKSSPGKWWFRTSPPWPTIAVKNDGVIELWVGMVKTADATAPFTPQATFPPFSGRVLIPHADAHPGSLELPENSTNNTDGRTRLRSTV